MQRALGSVAACMHSSFCYVYSMLQRRRRFGLESVRHNAVCMKGGYNSRAAQRGAAAGDALHFEDG
jgi:hypothetical protein